MCDLKIIKFIAGKYKGMYAELRESDRSITFKAAKKESGKR